MIVHNLRRVHLNHDGRTLVCDEHGPLSGAEADAAFAEFSLLHGDSESALERASRFERWPIRWVVAVIQGLHSMIDPPRCREA